MSSLARPRVVGVDVGGTKIMAGVVEADGSVHGVVEMPTPPSELGSAELERCAIEAIRAAAGGDPLAVVGVAAAAFVDADSRTARFAPHLAWRDEPAADRFEAALGVPVVLENDATATAFAEAVAGAGVGHRSVLVVTVGTGIGGGIVVDSEPWRGLNGMAGEFGHVTMVPGGAICACGGSGCWERYCSGPALLRLAGDGFTHGAQVTSAALAGDEAALDAFAAVGARLGEGLAGLTAVLDPAVVVIGGGVSAAGDLLLDPAREALARRIVGAGHRVVPPVLPARWGTAAGMVGAGLLAHRSLADGSRAAGAPLGSILAHHASD